MVANQTESSRLQQKSVIKFFVAEKYKPCKIYQKRVISKEKHILVKDMFINWLKMVLLL